MHPDRIKYNDKEKLKKARLQVHQAVQLIASTGISFAEKKADDSHTNMEWLQDLSAFAGSLFGVGQQFRLAFVPATLTYFLLDTKNLILDQFSLHGKTDESAAGWLKNNLEKYNFDCSAFTLKRHYEIPKTDQADGAQYNLLDESAFEAVSAHFKVADRLLKQEAGKHGIVSPVRCWPHHFDLAVIFSVDGNSNPAKSIGAGLSPGDDFYDQPYYYVYPWPYPDVKILSKYKLPAGAFWHDKGFTAAIVTAETYINQHPMQDYLLNFLTEATQISQKILS